MTTLTIKVPPGAKAKLSAKELGGEIIAPASKKGRFLNEIKEGLKDVKEMREGKSSFLYYV